jgi:hypothetical protein
MLARISDPEMVNREKDARYVMGQAIQRSEKLDKTVRELSPEGLGNFAGFEIAIARGLDE